VNDSGALATWLELTRICPTMLAERFGQKPPLFPAEPKRAEEGCFAAADGVARVEQVVLDLLLRNDSLLGVRQSHFANWLLARGMSRFTTVVLSPPEVCGNRDWRCSSG
jgi:hypothetical protein